MENKYENRKEIKKIRWLLFGVVISLLAADVLYQAVTSFMSSPPHNYIKTAIVEISAFALPLAIYGFSGTKSVKGSTLRLNNLRPRETFFVILLGITGQFVMMLLNLPTEYVFQKFLNFNSEGTPFVPEGAAAVIGGIFAVCIIPALLEEVCFRGIVFSAYNKISTKTAILFTTVIFALFHGKPEELPGYIFMGAICAYILLRTNSLFGAVLYHITSNLTALVFSLTAVWFVPLLWEVFAAAIIIFVFAFIIFTLKYKPRDTKKYKRNKKLFWKSMFSLPVILSFAVIIFRYWLLNIRA